MSHFDRLWTRRTSIEVENHVIELLGLPDLVLAKKTQRDKDWPMIRRLIEQSYFTSPVAAGAERVDFWLRELRTPELLASVAEGYRDEARRAAQSRPAVLAAIDGDLTEVARALDAEEEEERRKDRIYWEPLKRELEEARRQRGR